MSKDNIVELRGILFSTLRELQDPTSKMDIKQALAIKEVAQVIVESAKVEVAHAKATGSEGSGFIPLQSVDGNLPSPHESNAITTQSGRKTITQLGGAGTITQHTMRG